MEERHITDEKVTAYLDQLYQPLTSDLMAFREAAEEEGIPIILRDTEQMLSVLLHMIRPRHILEIGAAVGYSACYFAEVCPDARIVTIEKEETMARRAADRIRSFGYDDRIRVVTGDAAKVSFAESGESFSFVFIDAAKSHYDEFWDAAVPYLAPGGVIVCDNVLMRGSVAADEYDSPPGKHKTSIRHMREFLHRITREPGVVTSVLAAGDGLSVSYFTSE